MSERILLQQRHPDGTFQAIVEDDERTVYLYLKGPRGLRACWVRNRVAAPASLEDPAEREDRAPLQPAANCLDRGAQPALDASRLSLVWLQEGDGAALLEGDQVLAVLPGWGGTGGCPGYAKAARGRGPVAWSLDDEPGLVARVRSDRAWWARWDQDPFSPVRDAQLAAVTEQVGPVGRYFAIDGGRWPPRALALVDRAPGRILVTLGMGIRRQPVAEQHLPDDAPGRRVELALALHPSAGEADSWIRVLAAMAALPWRTVTWLGSGHTVAHPGLPDPWSAFFLHPTPPPGIQLTLPDIDEEPVRVLWATPITAAERVLAQQFGRDRLVERLGEALSQAMERQPLA